MSGPFPSGARLEVIRGCMFSGKTTELIRRLEEARGSGKSVTAIKPARDSRSGAGRLLTHTGAVMAAVEAATVEDVAKAAAGFAVVGIDEVHFYGAAIAPVCRELSVRTRVIIAGVALDHFGEPFEPLATLAREADEVVETMCPCAVCGGRAIHSQRLGLSTERIVVGGAESYEPRCAGCFVPTPR